ncbi:MAG TPA: NUDIX hydrolase [Rhodocyclaceae bacterium]|nr:NUDIX hydrolase [Rhodocyclaceae bacterium]
MSVDKHLVEAQLDTETVFKGKLLEIRRDKVALPDGSQATREYVVHPGAVVVLALLDNGKLLFERQFRYPLRQVFLELPAGKIDAGEDIEVTGRRELMEETGHEADEWRHVGVMHPCIGYSNERIEIFLARGVRRVADPQPDHGEFLEVLELSREEAREAIIQGRITDAKTVTALYWAEHLIEW